MRLLTGVCLLACLLTQTGCASYGHFANGMRSGLLQGMPEQSLVIAEAKDPQQQDVLASLDKGMLRRMNQQYAESNRILEVAKQKMETLYATSITENLASVAINEGVRAYTGDPYEQLLLHAFMAMNYIELGDLDAARVEVLQADVKMQEWVEDKRADAFVRYLAGMIFEALNEPDQALVSYRKAYQIYQNEDMNKVYPSVPETLQRDLLRLTWELGLQDEYAQYKAEFSVADENIDLAKNMAELIVLVSQGLAPVRSEAVVPVYSSEIEKNLRVAYPVYRQPARLLLPVRVVIDTSADAVDADHNDKDSDTAQVKNSDFEKEEQDTLQKTKQVETNKQSDNLNATIATLETVEDVDALARQALADAMPGIMARATARAVVKYNTQHNAQQKGELAGLLMTVTNLITERADTRSWTTLPQVIRLQRIRLPAGEHKVRIEIIGQSGELVDWLTTNIQLKAGEHRFLIKHWVAPVWAKHRQQAVIEPVTDDKPATFE